MSEFKIRLAQPGEESAIHEAHMRSIREICVKDHGQEEIRGWGNRPLGNRWTDAIKAGDVWVVESRGNIFGHGYIRIFNEGDENRAHVHGLYLTTEAVGIGLGVKLGQLMLEKAKKADVKKVTLESTLTAHKFYMRLGFQDTGPLASMEIAGYPVKYFPMALELE
jgi:GNAT superfamily N-acetyltransferase